jgi:L-aminopeptidase/D-esterase-like protein
MANELDRRAFGRGLAAALASWPRGATARGDEGGDSSGLTDVPGLKVGHFTETRRPTGCTVVLAEEGAVGGVDVRGAAPATRETDLLDPSRTVSVVHAVVLSGGSAFGLDAATGVMRFLEDRGVGVAVGKARVPIVPAAALFDLAVGDGRVRPDAEAGLAAARGATAGRVAEGNVGAGAGATVGKLFGPERAMKGGLGTAAIRLPGGVVVAALVAVNAVGDVVDPATGEPIAGLRAPDGTRLYGTMRALLEGHAPGAPFSGAHTTIGVVATNVSLDKAGATRMARMAHDGLARAVKPAHTPWDGDALFALSMGGMRLEAPELVVGPLAAEATARAIVRAVRAARSLPGLPAAYDLPRS